MLTSRRSGYSLLLSLLLLSFPFALQSADLDRDGIDEDFEETLAKSFLPMIWYRSSESCPEPGVILYHVRPFVPGGSPDTLSITYCTSYYEDCGINGHTFDLETVALTLYPLENSPLGYGVHSIRTWAHRGSLTCEITEERSYNPLRQNVETDRDTLYTSWEDILVSNDKHGFFLNDGTCDGHCFGADECDYDLFMNKGQLVPPEQGQFFDLYNIGEINDHILENYSEIDGMGGYSFGSRTIWDSTWMVDGYYATSPGPALPAGISIHSTYDSPLAVCEEQSVSFGLSYRSIVRSAIYDIAGNHLSAQYLGEFCAGDTIMARSWDGLDSDGLCQPFGNYDIVLEAYRGNDGASDEDRFGIGWNQGSKPFAPTNLSASASEDHVTLNWNDNSTTEDGFVVERRIGSCAFSRLDLAGSNPGTGDVTFTDYGVDPGVEYGYRVFAYRTFVGYSGYSNAVWVTIPDCAENPYIILDGPTINADTVYSSGIYTVTVEITDPDCPFLDYDWSVSANNYTEPGTIYGSGNTVTYIAPTVDCDKSDYPAYQNKIDVTVSYHGYYDTASTGWFLIQCLPPDTSGCPFLYVWDGDEFAAENNLLPLSEIRQGDVTDFYQLSTKPVPRNGRYVLEIREDESEQSLLDAVELLCVDHPPGTQIGVTQDGNVFGYEGVSSLRKALDSKGNDITGTFTRTDENVFRGKSGDEVIVDSGQPGPEILVMFIVPAPRKKSFGPVIIPDGHGDRPVGSVYGTMMGYPRHLGGLQFIGIPLSGRENGDRDLRLSWLGNNGVDYIGTVTGLTHEIMTERLPLKEAVHSEESNVTGQLNEVDDAFAVLGHGERIRLQFEVPGEVVGMKRDHILVAHGHYKKTDAPIR